MDTIKRRVQHGPPLLNIIYVNQLPNIVHVFFFLIFVPTTLPQNYYYYPQEYFYQPQQQQFYYPQQQQQFSQQQQYFVHYYQPQQQQPLPQQFQQQQFPQAQPAAPVQHPQRQIYVEQQVPRQQAPRQPPQAIQQPIVVSMEATPPQQPGPAMLPQKQMSIYDETIRTAPGREDPIEFDLPPPPPAQFLPDESEKIKIAQLLAEEYKAEQAQQRIIQQQHLQQQRHEQQQQQQQQQNNRQLIAQRKSLLHQQRQAEQQQTLLHQQQLQLQEQQRQQQMLQERQVQQQRIIQQQRSNDLTTSQPAVAPQPTERISSPPVSHLSPLKSTEPNKVFLTCCKKKRVLKSCESRCNFDNLNKKILTQMFLGTDPCPQSHGLDLFACAAQESDHRSCCRDRRVHRTAAGDKCLAFCNLTPESQFQADASYLPCWAVLNDVKGCFKDAIINGVVMP